MKRRSIVGWVSDHTLNPRPEIQKLLEKYNQDIKFSNKRPKYYKYWKKVKVTIQEVA